MEGKIEKEFVYFSYKTDPSGKQHSFYILLSQVNMADVTWWPGEQNYSCASHVTMNKKIFPIPYCVQQTLGGWTGLFLSYCGGSFSESAKGGGGPLWRKQWYLFTQHGNLPSKSILDSSGLKQNWHTPFYQWNSEPGSTCLAWNAAYWWCKWIYLAVCLYLKLYMYGCCLLCEHPLPMKTVYFEEVESGTLQVSRYPIMWL